MPINPFAAPGRWYRGNLHTHTTKSDGRMSPKQMVDWHATHGYDFLSLTEHRFLLDPSPYLREGLLLIPGIEVDGHDRLSGRYHLVGLGLHSPLKYKSDLSFQAAVDGLRAAGGLTVLAHPYWSGQTSADLLRVEGAWGIEVFNGVCHKERGRGLSTVHWDDLLAAGKSLWGLAVDDAHGHEPDGDLGWGWVMAKAQELSREAILRALLAGAFYSSTGPQIHDLRLEDGVVTVRCSPVDHINFICDWALGGAVHAWDGPPLSAPRFQLRNKGETYLRVECIDHAGGCAWSQPVYLNH